ncbi:unnamed protein product, partial [Oikopleura dioica]
EQKQIGKTLRTLLTKAKMNGWIKVRQMKPSSSANTSRRLQPVSHRTEGRDQFLALCTVFLPPGQV